MGWQVTPYMIPFAVSAAVAFFVLVPVYRNREQRGAVPLMAFLVGAFVWCFTSLLQLASTTEGAKLFWNTVRFLGPTLAPPSILLFVATFTNRDQWLRPRRVALLAVPEVVILCLVWTDPIHSLLRTDTALLTVGSTTTLSVTWGPLFLVHALYQYLLLVVALAWLVVEYRRARNSGTSVYRRQTGLVLFAMVIPWVTNATYVFDLTPIDPTPFGFAATATLFATALFRYRLLDLVPIARGTVIESMDNGVLVLDPDDIIVDANPRAEEVIDADESELVGTRFSDVFAAYPPILETFADARETRDQISIRNGETEYHYEVKVSPIRDSLGNYAGRTMVFDDITVQVERQQALAAREEELDLMRQVQSRVLRHNIRNDLQVVKMNTEKLAAELDGEHGAVAERTVERANDLLATSSKARTIERFVDQDQTLTRLDISTTLRDIVDKYRTQFSTVSFTLDCPEECRVSTVPAMELAFANVVENAAEHNDGPTPTVDIAVTADEETVVVEVSDNGPGIPAEELAVIEQGEETALEHGSGMGLWVIDWILDNTTASIQYETGEDGTTISIQIARDEHDFD